MQRKNDKHSDIFNDFIKEINNNNHPTKIKSDKTNNRNYNKNNKKDLFEYENNDIDFKDIEDIDNNIEDNKEDDYKEEEIQIKTITIQNDLLKQKIREKDNILKDYKNKCRQQKSIITKLNKKIQELNEKQKQKEIKNKEKEKNKFKKNNNSKDFINDSFEEKMAIKFVEQQIAEEIKKEIDKADNYLLLDKIETIIFNIFNTKFYQCGICMDSFNDGEKINKLSCQHIFHIECLNQWIPTNKKCPLCEKII